LAVCRSERRQKREDGTGLLTRGQVMNPSALNESIFDNPGPEARYWIGFLMADGNVSDKPKWGNRNITLGLSVRDLAHVEKFKEFVGSSNKIGIRPATTSVVNGRAVKSGPSAHFRFSSKRIAEHLIAFGVVPRKSPIAKVIGLEFDRDFWRGVIDGDGCVTWQTLRRHNYVMPHITLCGSRALMDQFSTFIHSIIPDCKAVVRQAKKTGPVCFCRTSGMPAALIIKHLYEDAVEALDRKAATAAKIIQWIPEWQQKDRDRKEQKRLNAICQIAGCEKKAKYGQLCQKHRSRLVRTGGFERNRKTWSHLTAIQLAALRQELGGWAAVSRHLGINRCTLAQVRRKLGMKPEDSCSDERSKTWDNGTCSSLKCESPVYCKGLCVLCYGRLLAARRKLRSR
jgi:hypothetical protein